MNNCGLSFKKSTKIINVFETTSNSSFNKPIKNSFWEKKKKIKSENLIKNREEVYLTTIDNYINKKNIKYIDLLKIDTQGFESYILKGCANALKKNIIKLIEIEFIMGNQYTNRINIIDLEKHLIKNNFRLYGINQSGDLLNKPDMNLDLLYVNNKFIKVD